MRCKLLARIDSIDLHESELFETRSLTFTSDKDKVIKWFFTEDLIKSIGGWQALTLLDSQFFCYSEMDLESNSQTELHKAQKMLEGSILGVFRGLWFLKDHAAKIGEIFLHYTEPVGFGGGGSAFYTRADGSTRSNTFTREEFHTAIHMSKELTKHDKAFVTVMADFPEEYNSSDTILANRVDYNSMDRIARALCFLDMARTASFMPMKISMYIPVLECLFTTEGSELTYKISSRCANYIGQTKEEKREVFEIVKEVYDFRSKFLHGSLLKKKGGDRAHNILEAQEQMSIAIDQIVRKTLLKAVTIDGERFMMGKNPETGKNREEELTIYFDSLLFT